MTTPPPPEDPAFPPVETLVIVGLGLIGGSVALAARERGLARRIVAVGRSAGALEPAVRAGVADEATEDLRAAAARGDLIVLARPVEALVEDLAPVLASAPHGALVTDAGSTKGRIVTEAERHVRPHGGRFVGSHPMAGSDRTGWKNARKELFCGATTFVTVTKATDPAAAARTAAFWRALGSRVIYSAPERHDQLAALVSHVPHLAAVALVEQVAESGEDPALLRRVAGTGFRDTTRVARGDAELWLQICRQNPEAVADGLADLAGRLEKLAKQVRARETGDGRELLRALEEACRARGEFDG